MDMDIESAASQNTQYAEKRSRGSRTSKEGDRQANQTGEHAGHRKKDTVEISQEARWAAMEIKELEPNSQISDIIAQHRQTMPERTYTTDCIEVAASRYILAALDEKVGDIYDVSSQLGDMLFSYDPNVETRAADREAGKDLAKYIADNYFDDPEEAQAFMNTINKLAELSEARDKGYVISFEPLDHKAWSRLSDEEKISYTSSLNSMIFNIEPTKPYPPSDLDRLRGYTEHRSSFNHEEYPRRLQEDYSPSSSSPSWEEAKEMNCDSKFSTFSEENKAWYAEFDAKVNLAQSIIDNAKSITDFSSNAKWKSVINLLTKAA
jgi:hypothetical protein